MTTEEGDGGVAMEEGQGRLSRPGARLMPEEGEGKMAAELGKGRRLSRPGARLTIEREGEVATEVGKGRPWRIEDFDVGKPLGMGRFGNVYAAAERKTGVRVALKVLNKNTVKAGGEQAMLNVMREGKIQVLLCHDHILRMIGYWTDMKNIYFMLEFAPGGEIHKLLTGGRGLPESDAVGYTKAVASAVGYLHERHIIHRDIKPENLLLDARGRPLLADFGWSVHAPPPHHMRSTLCGT
ncbi:unnamed protein product, partial [Discosporangium mesarthrocarpum]